MADDTQLGAPVGVGNVIRTLDDGTRHWPVGVVAYATTIGTPDVLTIPTAAALADNTSNPTTLLSGVCNLWYDGSTWDLARGDATNGLLVNLGSNNDVTLATLPDTAAGDLAAMRASLAGTLTVGSHAVTNAGTFAVQAAQSGTWNVTNISGIVSLPTGAATAAKQPALGTAGTASADVITVQGIASMTALQVSQSGNWSVRAQDGSGNALTSAARGAERALSVQLVDASGNQVTSLGGGTQYAEDAGHTTGDTGTMSLAVRNDSDTSLCGTTLDYTPLQVDANGFLKVNIKAGAGSGGTASTDDAAFTAGAGSGTPMMGFVTADAVDSGDVGVVGMLANRQLKVTLYDSGGVELAVGGGTQYDEDAAHSTGSKVTGAGVVRQDTAASLCGTDGDYTLPIVDATGRLWVHVGTVDGTVAATQSGTWNVGTVTTVTTCSTVTNLSQLGGQAIAMGTGVRSAGTQRVTIATDDVVPASQSGSWTVTANAGTNLNTSALALETGGNLASAVTALQIMDDWDNAASDGASVSGDVAHDAADSGEPVKIGAKATTSVSGLTVVADADRTNLFAGVDGVLITRPHCNLEDIVSGNASNTDGASTQVLAAGAAGIKHYLTTIILTNTSASNTYCEIKDGTTVMLTIPVPANGGAVVNLPVPLEGTAATAWNFDPGAATTTMYCSVIGFKSKV